MIERNRNLHCDGRYPSAQELCLRLHCRAVTVNDPDLWRELGQQLRVDSVRCAASAKSGHPTSGMSAADLMAGLLPKYLRDDCSNPTHPHNDRLAFSTATA